MGNSVAATAEVADGWLPIMFIPERSMSVWGDDLKRRASPSARLTCPRSTSPRAACSPSATTYAVEKIRDMGRPGTALYVGGMGARGKNFYNDLAVRYGFDQRPIEIQDLYLDGKKDEAAAKVPGRVAREDLARRPGVVHRRAGRRVQGGRCHRAQREPCRR